MADTPAARMACVGGGAGICCAMLLAGAAWPSACIAVRWAGGAFIAAWPEDKADRSEAADTWSEPEPAGEAPKADVVAVGEAECEGGVGLVLGDVAEAGPWAAAKDEMPGSTLGAMLELDLRAWCRLRMARGIGGGCTRFWGI